MDNFAKRLDDIHRASMTALDYQKTLELLRALKSGEVSLRCVQMTENGWQLVNPPPQAVPIEWVEPKSVPSTAIIELPAGGTVVTDADGKVSEVNGADSY